MTPPRFAQRILCWLLAPRDRESIPADLAEAYEEQVSACGHSAANRWYVRQVLSIAWHVAPRSPKQSSVSIDLLLGAMMAVGVVVTNVLLPLAHIDIVENDLTEVLPWAIVLLVIFFAGWSRRRTGLRAAVRAGSTVAAISFAIVIVTFLVVNNVFLGLVSQQFEKQELFRESGYYSMRVFVTVAQLRALVTVLPVMSLVGGLVGGVAGVLGRLRTR